jgi:hypothetical protein
MIAQAILTIACMPAMAESQPKVQVFAGYSYLYMSQQFSLNTALPHAGPLSGTADGGSNQNGWNASLAINLTDYLALVADGSGHYQSSGRNIRFSGGLPDNIHETSLSAKAKTHSFLFGPRVQLFAGKTVRPFVHALFGISRMDRKLTGADAMSGLAGVTVRAIGETLTNTGFTFATGGGVDWRCSRQISVRLIQADYIRTEREIVDDKSFFADPYTKDTMHNGLRISAGIIFNIGKK